LSAPPVGSSNFKSEMSNPLAHVLNPPGLLVLADRLYGRRPEAFAASVVGSSFDVSDKLSPPVQEGVTELVRQVADLVRFGGRAKSKSGNRTNGRNGALGTKPECPLNSIDTHAGYVAIPDLGRERK